MSPTRREEAPPLYVDVSTDALNAMAAGGELKKPKPKKNKENAERSQPAGPAKPRKHPIVGAIAGFFFLLFLTIELLVFGVFASDSVMIVVLPILGIPAGLALALWTPLGQRQATEVSNKS